VSCFFLVCISFSNLYAEEHYIFSGWEFREGPARSRLGIEKTYQLSSDESVIMPLGVKLPQLTTRAFLSGSAIVVKGRGRGGGGIHPHIGLMLYQTGLTPSKNVEDFADSIKQYLKPYNLMVYIISGAFDNAGLHASEIDLIHRVFEDREIKIENKNVLENVTKKRELVSILEREEDPIIFSDIFRDEDLKFKVYAGGNGQGNFGIIVNQKLIDGSYLPYLSKQVSYKHLSRKNTRY
jgi:hypothetical protein